MCLNFLQFNIDALAPSINNYANLSARISQSFEDFQSPLGTTYARYVQGHDQQNDIHRIEGSNCDRIESMRQIENQAFVSPGHQMKNFRYVLSCNVICFMCFKRCR